MIIGSCYFSQKQANYGVYYTAVNGIYLHTVPIAWISFYNDSREQLMDVYYLHAEPGFIFFFKTLPDPDQPAPYPIRTQTVFISACK